MSTSTRVFVAFACLTVLILGGAVGALATTVVRSGTVHVEVAGNGASGDHLSLKIPGFVLPLAARLVPAQAFRDAAREAGPFLPAVRAALEELSRCEDGLFVHVLSRGEEVRIGKKDGALYVHVTSDRETVHVSLPLYAVGPVLARLESVARQAG